MPANLLADMNTHNSGLKEQRALQIALELSRLDMNSTEPPHECHDIENTTVGAPFDERPKKSQNMTECVPVPSSEHVAEIVGRQGCKIKALRAKTNTYIKTPVRGEEPVFVVTGRKEDVGCAKREILSAAEHFSQIRASRRQGSVSTNSPPSPSSPGQVTIQVRVPYRVVGLVVGPKGATIKRIQQQTHTYIVTPSRDKEPIFEVTGLAENVDKAKQEIEAHIAMRTGGVGDHSTNLNTSLAMQGVKSSMTLSNGNLNGITDSMANLHTNFGPGLKPSHDNDDFHANGVDTSFQDLDNILGSSNSFKPPSSNSAFTVYSNTGSLHSNKSYCQQQDGNIFRFPSTGGLAKLGEVSALGNGLTSAYLQNMNNQINGFGVYDSDEGIGSPTFETQACPSSVWPDLGNSVFMTSGSDNNLLRRSNSFTDSTLRLSPTISTDHGSVKRLSSEPNTTMAPMHHHVTSGSSFSSGTSSSLSSSPTDSTGSQSRRRMCSVCMENEALVSSPHQCGHRGLCAECINSAEGDKCSVCLQQSSPSQAIRIFS
eukprot:GHVU01179708.1.p1 GENE.GHVU01179708.1~~GHVU01179708.1.p1  ORF type:complete len:541 (+),score=34.79 GHVU01179708.1:121-1743(+)